MDLFKQYERLLAPYAKSIAGIRLRTTTRRTTPKAAGPEVGCAPAANDSVCCVLPNRAFATFLM
jgi:hypothetical protein